MSELSDINREAIMDMGLESILNIASQSGEDPMLLAERLFENGELVKMMLIMSNPCLRKLHAGEPLFVLLGRDADAPHAIRSWASSREASEGDSTWTKEARCVADRFEDYQTLVVNRDASTDTSVERTTCCGHASDCAVHNAPAYLPEPCDCGFQDTSGQGTLGQALQKALDRHDEITSVNERAENAKD